MKKVSICLFVLLLALAGCGQQEKPEVTAPTASVAPTENTPANGQTQPDTDKYIIQTTYYQIYEEALQTYKYRIESGGLILAEDVKTGSAPQIEDKGGGILKLHLGFGTNAFTVQYFDVYNKIASKEFNPVSIYADYADTAKKEYFIAYFKLEQDPKLYIEGFFDSAAFSVQLDLNFAMANCEKLIFLNESEIYIAYTDKNFGETERVVNFRECALAQREPENLYRRFLTDEVAALDETGVKKFFREYLLWDVDTQAYTYTYLDMTGDGTPELCVKQYPQMYFFTVKNGEISHWYTETNSYVKLLNNGDLLFERHGAAPTHINYEYYELDKNATVTTKATFSWWDGETIEKGKVYPDTYVFDDKEVTKEEYEEKTRHYLSVGFNELVWYDVDGKAINEKTREVLQKVLDNEQSFTIKSLVFDRYTEENLEKFSFATEGSAVHPFLPRGYTYVDLDSDGIDELVVFSASLDYYLILRYGGEKVYGYLVGFRSLMDLKTDGSFMTSSGAGLNTVSNLSFQDTYYGTSFVIADVAYQDDMNGVYLLNGKAAQKEKVEAYFENWERDSRGVSWIMLE